MKILDFKNFNKHGKCLQIKFDNEQQLKASKDIYNNILNDFYSEIKNLPLSIRTFYYEEYSDFRISFFCVYYEEQELIIKLKEKILEVIK